MKNDEQELRNERLREEIKNLEHLEKLYRLQRFSNQIRYPDMTGGYLNGITYII